MGWVSGYYNVEPISGKIKLNGVGVIPAAVRGTNLNLQSVDQVTSNDVSTLQTGAINLSAINIAVGSSVDFVLENGYIIRVKNQSAITNGYRAWIIIYDSNNNIVPNTNQPQIAVDQRYQAYYGIADYFNIGTSVTYRGIIYIYQTSDNAWTVKFNRPSTELSAVLGVNVTPVYNWLPLPHLAGNSGQFQMDLSTLNASIIGDGETANSTNDHTKYTISSQSSIYNMLVNVLDNQETTVAYCGDNYMTVTRRYVAGTAVNLIYFTLKFYFRSGTLIYTSPEFDVNADHSNDRLLSIIYDTTHQVATLDLITTLSGTDGIFYNNSALPNDTILSAMYIWLQDNGVVHTGPYDTGTTDDGGEPGNPRPQDHITDSPLPTKGGLNMGLVTLYLPSDSQMADIAAFLWSDSVLDNFKKYFNNFADNILSCYSLPFTPDNLPTKAFKVGNMVSDTITDVPYTTVRAFDIDMGSVTIDKLWDSYLDFSPYTKAEIYLPGLGLHSLDIDEIMCPTRLDGSVPDRLGTVLNLVYRLDVLTGVVVAKLKVRVYTKSGGYTDQIRYQFSGRIGYNIPLTGQTYASMVQGILTAGAGVATTIASGGLTAPMTAAATVTATVQASKPNVERIGNISGDASMLATNVPYLILSSPNKPELVGQGNFTGFPSYKRGTLAGFTGYCEVLECHVEGMSATDTEKEMILSLLKAGVII